MIIDDLRIVVHNHFASNTILVPQDMLDVVRSSCSSWNIEQSNDRDVHCSADVFQLLQRWLAAKGLDIDMHVE